MGTAPVKGAGDGPEGGGEVRAPCRDVRRGQVIGYAFQGLR